jgi:hypothetical protein
MTAALRPPTHGGPVFLVEPVPLPHVKRSGVFLRRLIWEGGYAQLDIMSGAKLDVHVVFFQPPGLRSPHSDTSDARWSPPNCWAE